MKNKKDKKEKEHDSINPLAEEYLRHLHEAQAQYNQLYRQQQQWQAQNLGNPYPPYQPQTQRGVGYPYMESYPLPEAGIEVEILPDSTVRVRLTADISPEDLHAAEDRPALVEVGLLKKIRKAAQEIVARIALEKLKKSNGKKEKDATEKLGAILAWGQ